MDSKRPHSPSTIDSERPSKIVVKNETAETSNSSLLVKRVSERGRLPTRGTPLAAGYDLYRSVVLKNRTETNRSGYMFPALSAEDITVPANSKALVDTQLSIAVPVGTYGRVAPRSGLGGQINEMSCRLALII
jgi:dUTP pyrophosphatase